MGTSDQVKTLGDTIAAMGTAFRATPVLNAQLIGAMIAGAGDLILNATHAPQPSHRVAWAWLEASLRWSGSSALPRTI